MTTLCIFLTFACFIASCFRARWVALALAPPCALILARWTGIVDISSASHPLRLATALLGISLAMWAGWRGKDEHDNATAAYNQRVEDFRKVFGKHIKGPNQRQLWNAVVGDPPFPRAICAAVVVFASDCTDIPALFMWQIPGEWALVPLQILACSAVLFVLLAPERWLPWKISSS